MRRKIKPKPSRDDIREFERFAFIPTKLDDDFLVWLEFYVVVEKYTFWTNKKNTNAAEILKWGKWRTRVK